MTSTLEWVAHVQARFKLQMSAVRHGNVYRMRVCDLGCGVLIGLRVSIRLEPP